MYSGQADPAPTCNEYPMCMYSGHPQGMPLQKNIHHKSNIINHTSNIITMNNIWGKILKIVITVLTAIATTFGLQACI